jgi:lipopolysaccharide export system ATP-binding protein
LLVLNLNSQFTFLDEPFNVLAPIHIDIVKDLIRIHAKTKGIILTDHDYNNVLDVATKYMVLFDGGIRILKSQKEFVTWGYLPEKQNCN